jgi:hypothetical protein
MPFTYSISEKKAEMTTIFGCRYTMLNILTWRMFTIRRRSLPRPFPISALPLAPALRNLKASSDREGSRKRKDNKMNE